MACLKCGDACGWICEEHPERPWPHKNDDGSRCPGPGMPCDEPGCEFSLFGTTPQSPGVGEKMFAGVEASGGTVLCSVWDKHARPSDS